MDDRTELNFPHEPTPGSYQVEIANIFAPLVSPHGDMIGKKYTRTKRAAINISKKYNEDESTESGYQAEGFAKDFTVAIINGDYFRLTPMIVEFDATADAGAAEIENALNKLTERERSLLGVK
jgi:hypothetical protein